MGWVNNQRSIIFGAEPKSGTDWISSLRETGSSLKLKTDSVDTKFTWPGSRSGKSRDVIISVKSRRRRRRREQKQQSVFCSNLQKWKNWKIGENNAKRSFETIKARASRKITILNQVQWLWQHGCDWYQRIRVRIQSWATVTEQLFTVCRRDENKEKETGNGPFLNKVQSTQNHTLETKNEKPQFFVTDTR